MRGYVAAVVVIAVTALASCTDEPRPRFEEPTETPPASDSASSAGAEPEPWEKKTKAGAVAFARHWVKTFNQASASGSTRSLTLLSTQECRSCASIVNRISDLYGNGGRIESDGWKVQSAEARFVGGGGAHAADVSLRVMQTPQRVIHSSGEVERFEGGRTTMSALVEWRGQVWRLRELEEFR